MSALALFNPWFVSVQSSHLDCGLSMAEHLRQMAASQRIAFKYMAVEARH